MKNNSLKSSDSKCDSPKTPGGISKSLLTPCRRVGLSRNWRKSGPSPFISPLACEQSAKIGNVDEKRQTKKKIVVEKTEVENKDEIALESPKTNEISSGIVSTPSRIDQLSRKSKSKTLISSISCFAKKQEDIPFLPKEDIKYIEPMKNISVSKPVKSKSLRTGKQLPPKSNIHDTALISCFAEKQKDIPLLPKKYIKYKEPVISVSKPVKSKSLRSGQQSPPKSNIHDTAINLDKNISDLAKVNNKNTKGDFEFTNNDEEHSKQRKICNSKIEQTVSVLTETAPVNNSESYSCSIKEKSPNDLTKKCIVVIQRKINKNANKKKEPSENKSQEKTMPKDVINNINPVSQALFDSDSDEAPLSSIPKKLNNKINVAESKKRSIQTLDEVKELKENVLIPGKIKKMEDKSIGDMKSKAIKNSTTLSKEDRNIHIPARKGSQSSNAFDDDDDFDFDKKRTILIRKTYDKVIQPQKAKSTGSVTQKDIDDLKARIEMKKNMLLAKVMTKETSELTSLIKKWRKGCQDALVELMDLMKAKFPDKQYMDYSEILQMLKIPSSLVGYDSDNDSFISPCDADIILEKFS